MSKGTVRTLRDRFGFIHEEGVNHDLFFHCSAVVGEWELGEGDAVTFEHSEHDGKPIAINVQLAEQQP